MTGKIKSLLPTLSISLPAIVTGILIFNENKLDPLTSLFSKSESDKKQEEEIKSMGKDGDKNSKVTKEKSQKNKGKKESKGNLEEGEGEGVSESNEQKVELDSKEEKIGELINQGGEDVLSGTEEQSELSGNNDQQSGDDSSQEERAEENDNSTIIGSGNVDENTRESSGRVSSGGSRRWAGAFFDDLTEDYLD